MNQKTKRNDPCWCGSGRRYKNCHMKRAGEKVLPPEAVRDHIKSAFQVKQCLHPLASESGCEKFISAHTIQRRGALSHIIDKTNHVRTFYPFQPDKNGRPILHRRGWKDASTFSGFCKKHDNDTFAPLETESFTGSPEQCFLIGYRALCHEVYQKDASARAHSLQQDIIDKGRSIEEQQDIQHYHSISKAGVEHGLQSARNKKQLMDQDFLNRNFQSWGQLVIRFQGNVSIASTGAPTPTYDFSGNQLQILHNPRVSVQHLMYGIIPIQNGAAVVFSWLASDNACSRFIDSLEQLPQDRLGDILVQYMFAHVENTYFSDTWWSTLNKAQQDHIENLFIMTNPYYEQVPYITERLAPWKITSIERK